MRGKASTPLLHAIIHRFGCGGTWQLHTPMWAGAGAGPLLQAVVWHDGGAWRAALDTTELHPDPDPGTEGAPGALADCTPMTNFKAERQFGTFSAADAW